jgi:hypothetical protein
MTKRQNSKKPSKPYQEFMKILDKAKKDAKTMTEEEMEVIAVAMGSSLKDLTPVAQGLSKVQKGLIDRGVSFVLQDVIDPLIKWAQGGETPKAVKWFLDGLEGLLNVFIL